MLEDLYKIQLYKIYYNNTNNILPIYFQTFTPHYYNTLEHGHDLRHNVVRLPLTKREYYVYCTKYQFLKLIRDTSQSDLDRSLTSSLTQFIAYFKYSIIEGPNYKILWISDTHAAKLRAVARGVWGHAPPQRQWCDFVRFVGYFQPLS